MSALQRITYIHDFKLTCSFLMQYLSRKCTVWIDTFTAGLFVLKSIIRPVVMWFGSIHASAVDY